MEEGLEFEGRISGEMGVEGGTSHVSCKTSTKIGRLEEAGVRGIGRLLMG